MITLTYDNIKIKKKTEPHPLPFIFAKTRGGVAS